MKISVIIPARNEELMLPDTLAALHAQTFSKEDFEIIVADNGSKDRTAEIAREFGVQVVHQPDVTVAALRNRGAESAKGEILAFLDADCLAAPDWLSAVEQSMLEESAVTGCECRIANDDSWIARTWFCLQPQARERVRCIGSANLMLPRAVFDAIGGFDETLRTGEDCELCARAAAHLPVIADPRIRVVHRGTPKTLPEFLRREMWHGLGALGTVRHNLLDKPFLGTVAFVIASTIQVAGLLVLLFTGRGSAFVLGTAAVIALLAASVWHRRRFLRSREHGLLLGILYWFFYLGRSIALVLAMGKGSHYHENR